MHTQTHTHTHTHAGKPNVSLPCFQTNMCSSITHTHTHTHKHTQTSPMSRCRASGPTCAAPSHTHTHTRRQAQCLAAVLPNQPVQLHHTHTHTHTHAGKPNVSLPCFQTNLCSSITFTPPLKAPSRPKEPSAKVVEAEPPQKAQRTSGASDVKGVRVLMCSLLCACVRVCVLMCVCVCECVGMRVLMCSLFCANVCTCLSAV